MGAVLNPKGLYQHSTVLGQYSESQQGEVPSHSSSLLALTIEKLQGDDQQLLRDHKKEGVQVIVQLAQHVARNVFASVYGTLANRLAGEDLACQVLSTVHPWEILMVLHR